MTTALVTGANRGIGRHLASQPARAGRHRLRRRPPSRDARPARRHAGRARRHRPRRRPRGRRAWPATSTCW
nr:hypothetical protein [Angustibacter aerolatus]